jgi:DNA-binding SARP family transcriptional activator
MHQLDDARRLLVGDADAALAAMLTAADEVVAELRRHQRHAEQCEHDLLLALEAAAAGESRLALLIRMIHEFARVSEIAQARAAPSQRRGRRWWFGSERRRPPSPATLIVATSTQPTVAALTDDDGTADRSELSDPLDPTARASALDALRDGIVDDASTNGTDPPRGTDVAVYLLGPFHLVLRGQRVDASNGGKGLRVLKYLFAHRDYPVPKDVLIDLFWPDSDLDTVGRNLHQAIYTIRKGLRQGTAEAHDIVFENGAYLVNPDLSVWCDRDSFESSAAAGRLAEIDGRTSDAIEAFSGAARLYRGEYLADSPYEEWALGDRERLRLLYVDVANRLGDLLLTSGDVDGAVHVSRKLLRLEPCDESTHRRLIRCYSLTGQRNLAIDQYNAYVSCAERLYGLGPSPETTALYKAVIAK